LNIFTHRRFVWSIFRSRWRISLFLVLAYLSPQLIALLNEGCLKRSYPLGVILSQCPKFAGLRLERRGMRLARS